MKQCYQKINCNATAAQYHMDAYCGKMRQSFEGKKEEVYHEEDFCYPDAITPELSVITNIDFDHMKFLGDTRAKIAYEKAGIIKPNIP
ncbi:MAG: hypothetical protein IKN05_04955, partial [Clostridia bacterium]|nr:hypothetical protein [Clostridia bacterium]